MEQRLFIPGPVTCAPEVLAAMARPTFDHRGPEFAALLARVSAGMKPIFGTGSDVLVLGASGTGGLEAAVASAFSPGDKVLSCPVGVFGKRLAAIARTYGLEVEVLETPLGAALDAQTLAARLRADTGREIAGILLTQNETSTGVQNDMAALARAIGDHPATSVIDAVSGLGASAFEMDAWGFDVVVTASQKVLGAPPGLAMVAVSQRGWERIAGAKVPHFYFDLLKAREFATQGQTPWTPPVSLIVSLDVALELYAREGARNVYARHERNAATIREFAKSLGLKLLSREGAHSVTVVAIEAPAGVDVAKVRSELRERHGIVIGGGQAELKGKIFRIGTMGALSADDVTFALESFGNALAGQGYRAPVTAAR